MLSTGKTAQPAALGDSADARRGTTASVRAKAAGTDLASMEASREGGVRRIATVAHRTFITFRV
jgi:hypothetical protein